MDLNYGTSKKSVCYTALDVVFFRLPRKIIDFAHIVKVK